MNQDYQAYLLSPEWRAKREARLAISDGRCVVCGALKDIHVHHLTYARIKNEDLADLLPLCRTHHEQAESLIKDGVLSRNWHPLHAMARTLKELILYRVNNRAKLEMARPMGKMHPKECRQEIKELPWFNGALHLKRKEFIRYCRKMFAGHSHKSQMMANAIWIYDH